VEDSSRWRGYGRVCDVVQRSWGSVGGAGSEGRDDGREEIQTGEEMQRGTVQHAERLGTRTNALLCVHR
jgi:hypothetical protein